MRNAWEGEIVYNRMEYGKPTPSLRQWIVALLLFTITFLSASLSGLFFVFGTLPMDSFRVVLARPETFFIGLLYSTPLVAILLAHEMGHFIACRYYGIRCTPPYFIPVPISITGTLGAFIKIQSPFVSKRALFDVGIAGPLAGFVVTIPVLFWGIDAARTASIEYIPSGEIIFGAPLLFRFIAAILHNYSPSANTLVAGPVAMAAWFGLLVTSLNLLPVWQLDGGHIAYAVFGSKIQKRISIAVLALLILVGLFEWRTPSYAFFGLLVFILGYRRKFYHPATFHDRQPLGFGRSALACIVLIIFIFCFTPVPFSIVF